MKGRVTINKSGKLTIVTEQGTFTDGIAAFEKILAAIKANNITLTNIAQPEQHRHDEGETQYNSQEHTHVV